MRRDVQAHMTIDVQRASTLVLEVAVAEEPGRTVQETWDVDLGGTALVPREHRVEHGTRWHVLDVEPGPLRIDYSAVVTGRADPAPVAEVDLLRYRRPSRYVESDTLGPTAHAQFVGLTGPDLLAAVSSWVGTQLAYVPGSSLPTDGAVNTLLARRGVCRDYAHLVVALLRALDVPARLVAVYAPGLAPMDFHAVAEAYVDDAWQVVDATTLAPRPALLRIATGRDASDTAFLTVHHGVAVLQDVQVQAVADVLPDDDVRTPVALG